MKFNQNHRIVLTFSKNSEGDLFGDILGSRRTTSEKAKAISFAGGNRLKIGYGTNTVSLDVYVNDNNVHEIDYNQNKIFYDGSLVHEFTAETFETPTNALMFAVRGNANSTTYYGAIRIYRCKIYNGDTILHDFVPASDNESGGLYDLVDNVFKTNATSTPLVNGTKMSISEIFKELKTIQDDVAENANIINTELKNFIAVGYDSTVSGVLTDEGTISTRYGGTIGKLTVPTGAIGFSLEGVGNLSNNSTTTWSYIWFVSNGEMQSQIPCITTPQFFTRNNVYAIPEGTEEIWVSAFVVTFGSTGYFLHEGMIDIPKEHANLQKQIDALERSIPVNQWSGKSWYAYGTSITNTSNEGKYATYLASMSGMTLHNKGISGGGIGDLGGYSHGQVYDAICNITDGKLEADLITLETGANDTGASVPLGTVYNTGTSTLAGCLNDCLRYLQANTNAQICVTVSPATKTTPQAANQYYEWARMIEEICNINRVHFLNNNCNMGTAKLTSENGSLYVVDNIHQTELGGYIMAQNLWYQLRNIPCFYTSIPT